MYHHLVSHTIPSSLISDAKAKGISLKAILDLLTQYGPLAIQILTEILNHLTPKGEPQC
jgi:hypothetical protein